MDRFELQHGLEDQELKRGSRRDRATGIARYLLANPHATDEDGRNLTDVIVEVLVQGAMSRFSLDEGFDYGRFGQLYGELNRALERDGFSVEDGQLRRALPEALNLPQTDDEVHSLLRGYGFAVPMGHLDQAIAAHNRGDWAAQPTHSSGLL